MSSRKFLASVLRSKGFVLWLTFEKDKKALNG
jgi:hypothetical protein